MATKNRAALLKKLAKAKVGGRGNNFKDGKYRLAVKKMALEDKLKGTIFKTIFTVMNAINISPVQSVKTGEMLTIEPNRVGSDVDWIQTKLDDEDSAGPGNIRELMSELFNNKQVLDDDELYVETLGEMCDLDENGDPLQVPLELAKGMVIDMETIRIETKKNKKEIVVQKWSHVPQTEAERQAIITWLNQIAAQTPALPAGQQAA